MTTMSSDGSRDGRATFFEGARLIVGDGSGPVEGAGILVRGGQVVAVGPGARPGEGDLRVDLAGKTVMPTIVNPHGHIGYFKGAAAARENFSRENVLDHLRGGSGTGAVPRCRTRNCCGCTAGSDAFVFTSMSILEAGLRTYHQAGVRVLLSADTGLLAQFPGCAEHRELEAMVTAGMPALDAITAATLLPARLLGLAERGSLEPGKRADFIVLDANPLDSIANSRKISAVYIAGRAIDREKLQAGFGA
jgi:imidazolonepropionase-like amidohydrolase